MNKAIIVPLVLDALPVAKPEKHQFKSGIIDYDKSPPISSSKLIKGTPKKGIHLHWELPHALKKGIQTENGIDFPLVPNRWLIKRTNSQGAINKMIPEKLWLLKSNEVNDDVKTMNDSTPYPEVETIGVKKETWFLKDLGISEKESVDLTCVGPVSAYFSSFAPFCKNVFSLIDTQLPDLDDITEEIKIDYSIVGWYADPTQDIIQDKKTPQELQQFFAESNWIKPDNIEFGDLVGGQTYYTGQIEQVVWKRSYEEPMQGKEVKLALANSIVDAKVALAEDKTHNSGIDKALYRAFLNDQIDQLDTIQINAEKKIKDEIENSWFSKSKDGYFWKSNLKKQKTEIAHNEAQTLTELNQKQKLINEKARDLYNNQLSLFKLHYSTYPNNKKLVKEINNEESNLCAAINEAKNTIYTKQKEIEEIITKAIQTNTDEDDQVPFIKVPRKPFLQATDPGIIVTNLLPKDETPIEAQHIIYTLDNDISLSSQTFGEGSGEISKILFQILNNAHNNYVKNDDKALNNKKDGLTLTFINGKIWDESAWSPLFMDYKIKAKEFNTHNWEFGAINGKYNLTRIDGVDCDISQSIPLAPSTTYIHQKKYQRLLNEENKLNKEHILQELEDSEKFDFLAQSLDGFRQFFNNKNTDSYKIPKNNEVLKSALFSLHVQDQMNESIVLTDITPPVYYVPKKSEIDSSNELDSVTLGQQFYFTQLEVCDKFGRIIPIINDSNIMTQNNITTVAPDLCPTKGQYIDNNCSEFIFQLPPRLKRACKLTIKNQGLDDSILSINHIKGWVVINSINKKPSLFFYNNSGGYMGELYIKNDNILWNSNPVDENSDINTFKHELSELYGVIEQLQKLPTSKQFLTFIDTLQDILSTKEPELNNSNLNLGIVGRPLALSRQTLHFVSNEKSATSDKENTINVKIGEQAEIDGCICNDGVIGYFLPKENNIDYQNFFVNTESDQGYCKSFKNGIPIVNFKDNSYYSEELDFLMLVDPLMSFHFHSGILPVTEYHFNPVEIEEIVNNLEFYFKIPHVLTHELKIEKEQGNEPKTEEIYQVMPQPNAIYGKWKWVNPAIGKASKKWIEKNIKSPSQDISFSQTSIRAGFLKLKK